MNTTTKKPSKSQISETKAGTYVYDEKSGQVIQLSERIPGVSAKGKSSGGDFEPSCGKAQCCRGQGGCAD